MKAAMVLLLSAILLVVAGMLFGGGSEVTPLRSSSSWKDLSGPILFTKGDKVYRFFTKCGGAAGQDGCLSELPVYSRRQDTSAKEGMGR